MPREDQLGKENTRTNWTATFVGVLPATGIHPSIPSAGESETIRLKADSYTFTSSNLKRPPLPFRPQGVELRTPPWLPKKLWSE